jgi:hypothetical protein
LIPLLPPDTQDLLRGEAGYPLSRRDLHPQVRAAYLGAQLIMAKLVITFLVILLVLQIAHLLISQAEHNKIDVILQERK